LSVEFEVELSAAPPGDGGVGEVGVAEYWGVGATVEPDGDGVAVVEDGAAGGEESSLQVSGVAWW